MQIEYLYLLLWSLIYEDIIVIVIVIVIIIVIVIVIVIVFG